MDSKIAELWKDALDGLSKAERHLKDGESDVAKDGAKNAASCGQIAIYLLLRGREDDRKATKGAIALGEIMTMEKTCSRPQDYIAKARELLKLFSELSPPENKLPFK